MPGLISGRACRRKRRRKSFDTHHRVLVDGADLRQNGGQIKSPPDRLFGVEITDLERCSGDTVGDQGIAVRLDGRMFAWLQKQLRAFWLLP